MANERATSTHGDNIQPLGSEGHFQLQKVLQTRQWVYRENNKWIMGKHNGTEGEKTILWTTKERYGECDSVCDMR